MVELALDAAISRRSDPEPDSEQLRFAPRTWLPAGGTIEARWHRARTIMLFRAEGRENMIADRARPRGSLPFMDRRATLFYFAAAVPAVGFVHGPADVNPLDEAMLDSDPEGCFPVRLGGRVARPQELAVAADCSEVNIWWSIRACPLLSEADIAGSVASLDRAAYDPQRS